MFLHLLVAMHVLLHASLQQSRSNMQGSGDVDSLGNPYGFMPTPLQQHAPSFPVLVTTQMSRPRSVDQLILLSDGHYLSTSTASLSLRLVAYNADAHALTYARAVFQWQDAGLISATSPFILSLPVLPYASYAPSRSVLVYTDCTGHANAKSVSHHSLKMRFRHELSLSCSNPLLPVSCKCEGFVVFGCCALLQDAASSMYG